MGSFPIDITGKKYNILTATKFSHKQNVTHFWEFKCDCGKIVIRKKGAVTSGVTRSCGCLNLKKYRMEPGEACCTRTFYHYKVHAGRRGYTFKLNREEFKEITQKNCHYCDSIPSNITKTSYCNGSFIYNGIDRQNNDVGYEIGNVVPCCKICNASKSTNTLDEFRSWITKVYNNLENF